MAKWPSDLVLMLFSEQFDVDLFCAEIWTAELWILGLLIAYENHTALWFYYYKSAIYISKI